MSKMNKEDITQEFLQSLYEYKDGNLYHKTQTYKKNVGDIAGRIEYLKNETRHCLSIKGVARLTSRMIFLYHHGYLPKFVDHKDRNKLNNRIENLRAATHSQNMQNRTSRKGSTSKYLGVCLERGKYWKAQINSKLLGYFKDEVSAAKAYNIAAEKEHGEFANLNIL